MSFRGEFDEALAAADRVFADVPRAGRLDGCTSCYSEEELILLGGGGDPVEVGDDLVRRFAEEGIDHWDEGEYQAAWRRLAARIFRLLESVEVTVDPGLLLRGLGYSCNDIGTWPEREREAALRVLGAALDLWLVDGRDPDAVVELLGALAHVYDDIGPWFARIDAAAASGEAAEAGLVRLAASWAVDVSWGVEPVWWWYPGDPLGLARDWLCSDSVQARLIAFLERNPACKNAADALAATRALAAGEHSPWLYPDTWPPRAAGRKLRLV